MRIVLLVIYLSVSYAHAQDLNLNKLSKQFSTQPQGYLASGPSQTIVTPINNLELPELAMQAYVYTATLTAQRNEKWVNDCLNLNLDFELFRCKIDDFQRDSN